MLKAFGETGPLMVGNKEDRSAARELSAGAISLFKNLSSHHEIQFENPSGGRRYDLCREPIAEDRSLISRSQVKYGFEAHHFAVILSVLFF